MKRVRLIGLALLGLLIVLTLTAIAFATPRHVHVKPATHKQVRVKPAVSKRPQVRLSAPGRVRVGSGARRRAHAADAGLSGSLNFTGMAAGAKSFITVKAVTLVNVEMYVEYIEENGVKTEANFKIIKAATEPCDLPGATKPFEVIPGQGQCNVGIEFVSGAAGKNATYWLAYGPYIFCYNWASIGINS